MVQIFVATISGILAIGGSVFAANTTVNERISEVNTDVQVLTERQLLQYQELKGETTIIKQDVKEILRAVQ